jgi:hypothetical protein
VVSILLRFVEEVFDICDVFQDELLSGRCATLLIEIRQREREREKRLVDSSIRRFVSGQPGFLTLARGAEIKRLRPTARRAQ